MDNFEHRSRLRPSACLAGTSYCEPKPACPLQSLRTLLVLALAGFVLPANALAPGQPGTVLTIPVSGLGDTAFASALEPDGRIVVGGTAKSDGAGALARVTATGTIDTGFGTAMSGVFLYDLSAATNDRELALVRLSGGGYAACGAYFSAGTATDFLTVRFDSSGMLENGFNGGYAVTPYLASGVAGTLIDQCNAVGVQSTGKVISAGFTDADGPGRVMVTRHTTAGALDGTFAGGGKVKIDASLGPSAESIAHAMLVLSDDKLLIAGQAGGAFNNIEFLLMRLNADGTPDTLFGGSGTGIVRTPVGTGTDIAYAMALQPDGKIVLAGSSIAADGRADFALVRYSSAGVPDPNFGTGGIVTTPIGPGEDIAYAVVVMPWGRIVAAGSARISTSAGGTDTALVAYNADGTLDRFFADHGKFMAKVTFSTDEVINALVADVGRDHFWAIGAGVPISDRDFLVLDFGLPDTIFRDGFQGP